jgi:hypothetical protein
VQRFPAFTASLAVPSATAVLQVNPSNQQGLMGNNPDDYLGSHLNPCTLEYFACYRAITEGYQRYMQYCKQSTLAGDLSCIRHALVWRDILIVECGHNYVCPPVDCKKSLDAPNRVRCCPDGQQACGTGQPPNCADLRNDAKNCGSCGHDCGQNSACVSGTCVCKYGYYLCKGTCCPWGNLCCDDGCCGR